MRPPASNARVAGSGVDDVTLTPVTVMGDVPVPVSVVMNSTYARIPSPDGPGGGSCQAPATASSRPSPFNMKPGSKNGGNNATLEKNGPSVTGPNKGSQ